MSEEIEIFWKPQINDEIQGVYVDKLEKIGKYKSNLYKIQNDNIIHCIWGRVHLDSIMKTAQIGDKIIIRFVGVEKIKNNHQMKKYELEIL